MAVAATVAATFALAAPASAEPAANDLVDTITVTPSSSILYAADNGSETYTVTAVGADSTPVAGASVEYEVMSPVTGVGDTAVDAGTTDSDGTVAVTLGKSDLIGADTSGDGSIMFWVDQSGGVDSEHDEGEPSATASFSVTATPTPGSGSSVTIVSPTPLDQPDLPSLLQAGTTSITAEATLEDSNGDPMEGVHLAVDAYYSDTVPPSTGFGSTPAQSRFNYTVTNGTPDRVVSNAVTDADGKASATISVPADDSQDGDYALYVFYVSGSTEAASGALAGWDDFQFQTAKASNLEVHDVDAFTGGIVSIPVTVTDQFGGAAGSGVTVTYDVTSGRNAGAAGTVNTGADGTATITYPDQAVNPNDTTDQVDVSAPDITVTGSPVTVTYRTPPPPPANTPPVAQSQSVWTEQNTPVSITLSGSDADGNALTFTHASPSHGTLSGSGASLVYTPASDYTGSDSFTFTVSDGQGGTATGTVSITVQAKGATVSETVPAGGTASSAPAGSTPSESTPVIGTVTSPNAGTVTFTPEGTGTSKTGYTMLGHSFTITAPPATAADPLKLTFRFDDASLPAGTDPSTVTVFRDGAAIPACATAGATTADPDPCVTTTTTASGVTTITVLSSHASLWSFGVKSAATVSKVKVDCNKGAVAGAPERCAVRVWNSDDSLAAKSVVALVVSGANSATGTATTGPNGELGYFTYTPKKSGTDTVTATAGTATDTTKVTIGAGVASHLFHPVAQRNGTFLFSVQTIPAATGVRVNLFAVYHPGRSDQKLLHAGNGTANLNGRAVRATSPGYLVNGVFKQYRAGQDYVLVARVVDGSLSNMQTATAR